MTRIPNGTLCLIVGGSARLIGRQCCVLGYSGEGPVYDPLGGVHFDLHIIDIPGWPAPPGTEWGCDRKHLLPLTGGAPDAEPRIVERPREVVA